MNMEVDLSPSSRRFPEFKDIRKPTIQQTYQYVMQLIGNIQMENIENLKELLDTSKPLPVFDESLRILVINRLNVENEVIKVLLSQNDDQIKRILNCNWFFKFLPLDFSAKELFPYVSVSLRCKIITKLSKHLESTEEAEKYFWFIKDKYGSGRADCMLPKCSQEFILNYFNKFKPTFGGNSGKRCFWNICQRYPELGFHILSEIFVMKKENSGELNQYKNILQYLGGCSPDLMSKFLQKHHSYMPSKIFGRKLSKKIGPKLEKSLSFFILEKEICIHQESLFLLYSPEVQIEFLVNFVRKPDQPPSLSLWENAYNRFYTFMKLIPQKNRLNVIKTVFFRAFNKNFDDHTKCWIYGLLEVMPAKDRFPYLQKLEKLFDCSPVEFEKIVHDSYSNSVDYRDEFYALYDGELGFEKIREVISQTPSSYDRERIMPCLVDNSRINNDIKALEKQVEFITTRHRKDDDEVLARFINPITDHFRPEILTQNIYERLIDLIYLMRIREAKEFDSDDDYKWSWGETMYTRWTEMYIYYRLQNNLDIDKYVDTLFNRNVLGTEKLYVKIFNSKYTKTLILAIWEKVYVWLQKNLDLESKKANTVLMNMLGTCKEYNNQNKGNKIYLKNIPGLQEILKRKLSTCFVDLGGEHWPLEIWDKYYQDVCSSGYKMHCLHFALKRTPNVFVTNFQNVLSILFSDYCKTFWPFYRDFMMLMSFSGKTETVLEIILNEFKKGDKTNKQTTALTLYSHFCTIEDFTKAIEEFLPKQKKIENSDSSFDTIQLLIPKIITNIKPRWRNFDLISKFFFGDFLKNSSISFRCCCYHTRLDLVLPYLKERFKSVPNKISYQKSILKLIVELSNNDERPQILKNFWNEFEDNSIRGFLLKFASDTFIENPSKETFSILVDCVLNCNETLIKSKPSVSKIPKEFFNDYVVTLWQFSEKMKPKFSNNFRSEIIQNITPDNINLLNQTFCESILKEYLFNPKTELDLSNFSLLYINSNPKTTKEKIIFIMNLIKEQEPPQNMIERFLKLLLEKPSENSKLFGWILQNWPDFSDSVCFSDRELLKLHCLYHESLNSSPSELAKALTKIFLSLKDLNDLMRIYAEVLKKFLTFVGVVKAVCIVKEIILNSPSITITILGICSLPSNAREYYESMDVSPEEKKEVRKVLDEVVKVLESSGDKVLGIFRWNKLGFVKP